jgi:hypothetical protein
VDKIYFSATKEKVYCLLIKSKPTGGFNLKSSYSYSINDEKFILQLKLEPTEKFLIRGIVGL